LLFRNIVIARSDHVVLNMYVVVNQPVEVVS